MDKLNITTAVEEKQNPSSEEDCSLSPEAIVFLYITEGFYRQYLYSSLNNGETDTLGIGHDYTTGDHTKCCQVFRDRGSIDWKSAVTYFWMTLEKIYPMKRF